MSRNTLKIISNLTKLALIFKYSYPYAKDYATTDELAFLTNLDDLEETSNINDLAALQKSEIDNSQRYKHLCKHKMIIVQSPEKKKRNCTVPTCRGERFDLVHKFPMENDRALEWLKALDIPALFKLPLEKVRKSHFICSRHFRNQDYKNVISRHLNKTAIPSINLKNLDQIDTVMQRTCPRPKNLIEEDLRMQQEKPESTVVPLVNSSEVRSLHSKIELSSNECKIDLTIKNQPQDVFSIKNNVVYETDLYMKQMSKGFQFDTIDEETQLSVEYIRSDHEEDDTNILTVEHQLGNKNNDDETRASSVSVADEIMSIDDFVEVLDPDDGKLLRLNHFWLRDHCRCPICYNHDTFQRRYNLFDIAIDVRPMKTHIQDECLSVTWSDGHKSEYQLEFLRNAQYKKRLNYLNGCELNLWDKESIRKMKFTRTLFNDFLTNDESAKQVVRNILEYGFAFIDKVPATTHMTETAVRRIFPIQKTLFGEMWTFTDEKAHSDTAYTNEYLAAHTDNTYFNDAAGLQVFHCLRHTGTGGESLLVDGFKVLKDFSIKNPKAYKRLTEIHVPGEYIENGIHHLYSAPIINLNSMTNEPEQIRFNLYDRSVFNTIPQNEMMNFYKDFRELIQEVQSSKNEWSFKLNPGTILLFDNWRILHGRQAYKGMRQMTGCYVSRTEFLSTARTMGLII